MTKREHIKDRMMGCLYGQAIGDALGLGGEGQYADGMRLIYPEKLRRYDEIIPNAHVRHWKPAAFTDDTNQMLCLLQTFLTDESLRPSTLAKQLMHWFETDGVGCGCLTRKVFAYPDYTAHPIEAAKVVWEQGNKNDAPNDGLMRTSIVGLSKENVVENAETGCRVTHYDPRCVGSCVLVSQIIHQWYGTIGK